MASGTRECIRIAASPGQVLDEIVDVESYPEWTSDIRSVTVLQEDSDGWPLQVEFVLDAGPIKDTYVLDYTWDVDEAGLGEVSWSLVRSSALRAMDGRYVLETDGTATLLTYELTVDLTIPLPGVLRRKAEKSIVATALSGLKRRVEG